MTTYRVTLNPTVQVIVPGHWPHTVIGEGIEQRADSAAEAIAEVADSTGITSGVLVAAPVEGR